jgi:phosphate starvation-inducible PhoH-like protein
MVNKNSEEYADDEVLGIDLTGIKKGRKQIKNKIQFNVSLNSEQKEVKSNILKDTVSVLIGKAGSGKTLLATQIALEYLFYREVERIIITRPTVSNEDIGFLPGNIKEKMDPWVAPIHANMYILYGKQKIDKCINDEIIEIAPISFLRGRTFVNACVIVDEAQNVTKSQMEMILSRLGINSKMIICGDMSQTDLKSKKDSGFPYLFDMIDSVPGLGVYELKTNHRHPIVDSVLNFFEEEKK